VEKTARVSVLKEIKAVNGEIFRMNFSWTDPAPAAGQFFMIKPLRSSVFLGRAVSAAAWNEAAHTVSFLIALRGRGTEELFDMRTGEKAELIGPLGNTWAEFLPPAADNRAVALLSGGIGIAPLKAFAAELEDAGRRYDFYAGFRKAFDNEEERKEFLGNAAAGTSAYCIAFEDPGDQVNGSDKRGLILDYFDPEPYAAVYVCGPEAMLRAAAAKCKAAEIPCFISMERKMACGVGACLGCSIETTKGMRRCCAGGPVFNAGEIVFNE
jgi:NAD(P)H-flavin reductase